MDTTDRKYMEVAIEAARKSVGKATDPRVGAVAVINGQIVGTAYRAQIEPGQHAEFILLAKHLETTSLAGATVYTTLEPCTVRNPPKIPCVERLIQRRISRVVIGMLDPNPLVSGLGYRKLRQAGISVAVIEDDDLVSQLEELNRDFILSVETSVVHHAAKEIVTLATRPGTSRQQEAAGSALRECLDSLTRINHGEIRITGQEGGYFRRWLERLDGDNQPQRVKAFIRLTAFEPDEVVRRSWFQNFYNALDDAARIGKLRIEYIFLLRTEIPEGPVEDIISRFKKFAEKISYISQRNPKLPPESLRPSIVLFETQQIAFTHERADDGSFLEASEWVSQEDYARLHSQFDRIELMSTTYFVSDKPSRV